MPAGVGVLAVPLPVRRDVPGVPDRQAVHGRRLPSASTISNAAVFWPSMRAGLTELTTSTPGSLPELANDVERDVEVAVDRDDPRAVNQRLRKLSERDLSRGEHDRAQQTGASGVRGR